MIPPVQRSISVSWDPETSFRRFTADFARWWPRKTHSIGGPKVKDVVFEGRVGGRIFEEHSDGRRFQWGQVLEWDPPRRVKFTFHPSRDPSTAQEVELRFVPDGSGTRLELVATNWEKWGAKAAKARKGYDVGWMYVLHIWAERRTARIILMDAIIAVAEPIQLARHGGRAGIIKAAGGEIAPAT
jgi:uncharacterized protein YndB with AHSA1/START domain